MSSCFSFLGAGAAGVAGVAVAVAGAGAAGVAGVATAGGAAGAGAGTGTAAAGTAGTGAAAAGAAAGEGLADGVATIFVWAGGGVRTAEGMIGLFVLAPAAVGPAGGCAANSGENTARNRSEYNVFTMGFLCIYLSTLAESGLTGLAELAVGPGGVAGFAAAGGVPGFAAGGGATFDGAFFW